MARLPSITTFSTCAWVMICKFSRDLTGLRNATAEGKALAPDSLDNETEYFPGPVIVVEDSIAPVAEGYDEKNTHLSEDGNRSYREDEPVPGTPQPSASSMRNCRYNSCSVPVSSLNIR